MHGVQLPLWLCVTGMVISTGGLQARQEIPLAGTWEYARGGTWDTPPQAGWQPVQVPGQIQQTNTGHVAWFRRSIDIPQTMIGAPLYLRFTGVKYRCRGRLNGQDIGEHWGGYEPFLLNITNAARPGQNELLLAVGDGTQIAINPPAPDQPAGQLRTSEFNDRLLYPVGSHTTTFGIWDRVSLLSVPPTHVADVFVQTSVRQKRITVDCELRNVAAQAQQVQLAADVVDGDRVVKRLGEKTVDLPAGQTAKTQFQADWPDAELWWPHSPKLYHLVARVMTNGTFVDEYRTRFGFREFWTDGIHLVLNGTRINFLATATHPGRFTREAAQQTYEWIRKSNCMAMRLHAQPWGSDWYEVADEMGILLIHESAIWCDAAQYALKDERFWQNFQAHLEGQIRLHRNNPSVVIWSLENELLHVGGGREPTCEKRLADLGRFVKTFDPTRPILYDADLEVQGVADIINIHYPNEYPDVYQYPQAADWATEGTAPRCWRRGWKWQKDKPLYVGEFLWCPTTDPAAYTMLLGDEALRDWSNARRRGQALAWEHQILALRRARVAGMCPWNIFENNTWGYEVNRRCYEPNGAYPRELDSRFFAGETVPRTVDVYNDTLSPRDLSLRWRLGQAAGQIPLGRVSPADMVTKEIALQMPQVDKPTKLDWQLDVTEGNTMLFADQRSLSVWPKRPISAAGLKIGLYDPQGATSRLLTPASLTPVSDLKAIPQGLDLLIVGASALKTAEELPTIGRQRGGSPLMKYAEDGGRVLVLEQDELPSDLGLGRLNNHQPTMCFVRARPGQLMEGLSDEDFHFWRGDHIVAKKSLSVPDSGAYRVIVESGSQAGLTNAQVLELLVGRGRIILCQLSLVGKSETEPMAREMLNRLMTYTAPPAPPGRPLAAVDQEAADTARRTLDGHQVTTLAGQPEPTALLFASGKTADKAMLARLEPAVRQGATLWLHRPPKDVAAHVAALANASLAPTGLSSLPVKWTSFADPLANGATDESLCWLVPSGEGGWRTTYSPAPDVADYALGVTLPATHGERLDPTEAKLEGSYVYEEAGAIHFASAGTAEFQVTAPRDGLYGFLIVATGTPAAGVYPIATLAIDGKTAGGAALSGPGPESFAVTCQLAAGPHTCTLRYINDAVIGNEDRNLLLRELRFGPAQVTLGSLVALTEPIVLARIPLGQGQIILDTVRWSDPKRAASRLPRQYAAQLATNLGVAGIPRGASLTLRGSLFVPDVDSPYAGPRGDELYLGFNCAARTKFRVLDAGQYRLTVQARGTQVDNIWPEFRILVDGKPVGSVQLHGDDWQTNTIEVDLPAGERELAIQFVNDKQNPPEDRNLWVRAAVLTPI